MTTGGDGKIGCKASEETKQKQSKLKQGNLNPFYGKQHTEETKSKISKIHKCKKNESQRKKVLCIDTGMVYDSLVDAAVLNSIDVSNLSKACRNNSRCKKMKWKYVEK